ncbi:hypothetical protein OAJ57_02265 [Alphaproteobacteria bacterium]|nr:hypothetical protein [Alphaproteobacteria bacterium]
MHKDDCVCMLASIGEDGPYIGPNGSVIVLDDGGLAYWERPNDAFVDDFVTNPNVAAMYNDKATAERGEIDRLGVISRTLGTTKIHECGYICDKIRSLLQKRQINHYREEKGFAVVISLTKAENLRGEIFR